jgi:hypothetical protein
MNEHERNLGNEWANMGAAWRRQAEAGVEFDRDQPSWLPGRGRDTADKRSQGSRRKPETDSAIPEIAGPAAETAGEEGRDDATATMPPGEGHDPKRNTI